MDAAAIVLLILLVVIAACLVALRATVSCATVSRASVSGGAVDGSLVDGSLVDAVDGSLVDAVDVTWVNAPCYPPRLVADALAAARAALAERGHAVVADDDAAFVAEAARLSRAHDTPFAARALASMYRMEAAARARKVGARALRHGAAFAAALDADDPGAALVAAAARAGVPPLAAAQQALSERGYGPRAARAAQSSGADALPPRVAAAVRAAAAADPASRENALATQKQAAAFEVALGARLRALGLDFVTEAEARLARGPGGGSARGPGRGPGAATALTPDFLLKTPARINGRLINWVEAKNFPCYGAELVAKKNAEQVAKYCRAFGPGAVVFSGGLACGVQVHGPGGARSADLDAPLLLDGSDL